MPDQLGQRLSFRSLHPAYTEMLPLAPPTPQVFGKDAQRVVANLNIEGQHRGAVAAARTLEQQEQEQEEKHQHHHHHHEGEEGGDCKACKEEEEGHEHHHEHHHGSG